MVGAADENGLTKTKAYCVLRDRYVPGPEPEEERIAFINRRLAQPALGASVAPTMTYGSGRR